MVTGQDVADFLGQGDNTELVALAGDHATIITALVKGYTRGNGFTDGAPDEAIAAVITTTCARLVTNPAQAERESADGYSVTGGFHGYTLAELFVLNSYRKRTR